MGLKSKMLIKNFLADKKKGLEIFFGFLKSTGIWSRVSKSNFCFTDRQLYDKYYLILP